MLIKKINGREVRLIGYDAEKKECHIVYNHFLHKSNSTYCYYDVEPEQFEKLMQSQSVARDADEMFKLHHIHIVRWES